MSKSYGNDSISSLKGADRVRKRPGVIFGSNGLDGCEHAMFEILSNSIDEAKEGFGTLITVTRFRDKSIEVADSGRGIPLDYNPKEERYNWELVFCELYAGGKYDNNSGKNYEYSLGLNGLGSCATQYASEYMEVNVQRDGFKYQLFFEKGENVGGLYKEPTRFKKTGTTIKWKPDLDVFTDIDIPLEYYKETLKKQAVVNAGITFKLRNETEDGFEEFDYFYANGIEDYLKELCGGHEMTAIQSISAERVGRDREDKPEYKLLMNFAFCFSNSVNVLEYYHNSSFLEHGGSPDKAVRNAFVYAIDSYIKQNNKYTKNESKITFQDVSDSLALISNSFSTYTDYENQTAEKTKANLKKKLAKNIDITNRVQKFVDCRTRDVSKREVYIVEGDSALGSCKLSRDAEFQAIIPVRGKILNCLKSDMNKIFKNDIIMDLMRVLGCGVEVKSKDLNTFDLDSLRWSKVIICTDADVDGFQIRTLILTMIFRLVPTLIREGKVFIAESPLFEITTKKDTFFAYNEKEKADILQKIGDVKYTVQRSKGLGENDPDMMWETTMNPETRRLIKVMPDDEDSTLRMFDLLLGDNLQGRKDYIAENGAKYIDLTDVS